MDVGEPGGEVTTVTEGLTYDEVKTSLIRQRVADFLQRHAPFDAPSEPDLLEMASSGKVKFHESEEYVFRQGDRKGLFIWMIQQGRVELVDAAGRLLDLRGEGDLLGLEQLVGEGTAGYSARTATDVILYGVAAPLFEAALERYPAMARFLSAHSTVGGNLEFSRTSWLEAELPPAAFFRARRGREVEELTTRAAVRAMLRGREERVGITAAELAMFCGYDPAGLIRAIREAGSTAELGPLLRRAGQMVREGLAQLHDVDDCRAMATAVMAALMEACIRIAGEEMVREGIAAARLPHCWVVFGTAARADLLTPPFPTLSVIYDDSDTAFSEQDSLYFTAMVGSVAGQLHEFQLEGGGFYWMPGALPSMPLGQWKRLYGETIRNPEGYDLYTRRLFFDLAPVSGDGSILQGLRAHVLEQLREQRQAIEMLAHDTLRELPPLTFFGGMVMEIGGEARASFDVDETMIRPLANAVRVFAMAKGRLEVAGTLERFDAAMVDFPDGAAVLREAAQAFRVGLYYQAIEEGGRIEPVKLGKFEQRVLKTAFGSIQRFLEYTYATFATAEVS